MARPTGQESAPFKKGVYSDSKGREPATPQGHTRKQQSGQEAEGLRGWCGQGPFLCFPQRNRQDRVRRPRTGQWEYLQSALSIMGGLWLSGPWSRADQGRWKVAWRVGAPLRKQLVQALD